MSNIHVTGRSSSWFQPNLGLVLCSLVMSVSCGAQGPEGSEAAIVETGELVAELTTVPSGMQCIKLTSSNGNISKLNTVTAGSSSATVSAGQLPLGYTSITATGYNVACASVTSTTAPNWIGKAVDTEILALGTTPIRLVLVPAVATNVAVDFVQPAMALALGAYSTYSVSAAGDVRAWGYNGYGSIGDGTYTNRYAPAATTVGTAASVGAGDFHACLVTAAGALKCWGNNADGEYGNGTTTSSPTAVTVISSGVKKIAGGASHTCILMTDGSIRCTGYNGYGQLGLGNTTNVTTFTAVTALGTNNIDIAAGVYHSCALTGERLVRCWGYNAWGQLGDSTTNNSSNPTTVSNLAGVESMDLGNYHTCARLGDGSVWCWGYNSSGQLGDGTTTNRTTPVASNAYFDATSLSAGGEVTCAVGRYKDLYCWGMGANGQSGQGNGAAVLTPTRVEGITDALEVVVGFQHACVRQNAGGVSCWGYGYFGTLGTGTTDSKFTPSPVLF